MIVLVYLAFPIYRLLCEHRLALLAATTFALLFAFEVGRPSTRAWPWWNFIYFQSAYLAGLTVCVYREQVMSMAERYLPWLVAVTVAGAALIVGVNIDAWHLAYLVPLTLVLLVALRCDNPINSMLEWIAPRAFGIFFLHGFITENAPDILGKNNSALFALAFGIALIVACGLIITGLQAALGTRSRLVLGS